MTRIHPDRLLMEVCHEFQVTRDDVLARVKVPQCVLARQTAMYLMWLQGDSICEVAARFGVHNASVYNALKATKPKLTTPRFTERIERLLARCK